MAPTLEGHNFVYYGFPLSSAKDFQVMQDIEVLRKPVEQFVTSYVRVITTNRR